MASHIDDLIKQMCNRAILLDHGRLVADGKPEDIIAKYHAMPPAKLTVTADAPAFT